MHMRGAIKAVYTGKKASSIVNLGLGEIGDAADDGLQVPSEPPAKAPTSSEGVETEERSEPIVVPSAATQPYRSCVLRRH